MRDWLCTAALERRHDGPVPPQAAVPADCMAPWVEQLRNRRQWAWRDVRRVGRRLVMAGRLLRATRNLDHYREWRRLRHELAFALRTWKSYRDWSREATYYEACSASTQR